MPNPAETRCSSIGEIPEGKITLSEKKRKVMGEELCEGNQERDNIRDVNKNN